MTTAWDYACTELTFVYLQRAGLIPELYSVDRKDRICNEKHSPIMGIYKCEACVSARVLYINQSIDQSVRQKAPSHSINQSIHNLLLIFVDSTNQATNQSIDLSVPWHFKHTQSINQLTFIPKSVFSLNCRGLRILMVSAPFWVMRKLMELWDRVENAGKGENRAGWLGTRIRM